MIIVWLMLFGFCLVIVSGWQLGGQVLQCSAVSELRIGWYDSSIFTQ